MAVLIAYIDSSVLLRVVLDQENPLAEWNAIDVGVVSTLVHLEVVRTLDRLSLRRELTSEQLIARAETAGEMLYRMVTLELDQQIIDIASQGFPAPLATLDALHLASAIVYRAAQSSNERAIALATHDHELAAAARALHFDVLGV